jgi:CRISPR/Cas system-associated exonuclease Cas4 (RecB family)
MPEPLPLSLLNDYLYCPRRAALKVVEGWRSANEHTNRGDIVHEHSDLAGYEVVKGVTLLAITLINRQQIGPGHFKNREGGAVEFTEAGRKLVIKCYQERKQESLNHPLLDQNLRIA